MAGILREIGKKITRSPGWSRVRQIVLICDGEKCRACGRTHLLQVHHIRPFHLEPSLELQVSNLITLCDRCHLLIGHLDNYKAYNPEVVSDAALVLQRIHDRSK